MRTIALILAAATMLFIGTAASQPEPAAAQRAKGDHSKLEIHGDTVTVVKALPFKVVCDDGAKLWFWEYPQSWQVEGNYTPALTVKAAKEGSYTVSVVSVAADWKRSQHQITVHIGKAPQPDPEPGPGPEPEPGPSPIPAKGLHVLMVYESKDLSKLPKEQLHVLYSEQIRSWLNAHCAPAPDGKTKAWRIWDKDVQTAGEDKLWQEAMARPRKSLPWIIVSNPDRGGGYEGPLPANTGEMLDLLQKFGG